MTHSPTKKLKKRGCNFRTNLDEDGKRVLDLFEDHLLLVIDTMLQDALNHPATVGMHRQLLDLSGIKQKHTKTNSKLKN